MAAVSATVGFSTPATPEAAFDRFVAAHPSRMVRGFGPFPAVVGTSDARGAWGELGAVRTVHLRDGSTARETVTRAERPGLIAYRVDAFTNALRWLARDATAEWRFEASGEGTRVVWTYTFRPRSRWVRPVLLVLVRGPLRAYMCRIAREVRAVTSAP